MRWLIAVALVGGCHCGHASTELPTTAGLASSEIAPAVDVSVDGGRVKDDLIPHLPQSPDGLEEIIGIDKRVELHRNDMRLVGVEVEALRNRIAVRGALADYQALLDVTKRWIDAYPTDEGAQHAWIDALQLVHRFADAKLAAQKLKPPDVGVVETIDEATGDIAAGLEARKGHAAAWPNPQHLVGYGALLAQTGQFDAALAQMKLAVEQVHDNSPLLFAWWLFQWGRVYELKGDFSAARRFYVASRARIPTIEATVHLIQAMQQSGDSVGATQLAAAEATSNPYPDLLALAGRTDEAKAAWVRYVAVLPEAFSDHAARFYLGAGKDPTRALALARANLEIRKTPEAYALVIEAALAANDAGSACAAAASLADQPLSLRSQQFLAWRAFSSCHQSANADKLAKTLGINGSGSG